jgi:hypothetical protein
MRSTCRAHLIIFYFITGMIFGEEVLHNAVFSTPLLPHPS